MQKYYALQEGHLLPNGYLSPFPICCDGASAAVPRSGLVQCLCATCPEWLC